MTLLATAPPVTAPPTTVTALDLFAGTGWGVACQSLGIHEQGVEIMDDAVASRTAAGMDTIYRDVWDGLADPTPRDYDLLIASPPCQTFSAAGSGKGRQALDVVLSLIAEGAYGDLADLRAFGESHDPRTALVLTPLAHVARDRPRLVVWEQVPPVLPVWEAAAEVLRADGYSVATGIVNAEQYGVPQTRRRAILVARLDAVAKLPTPTHSRYYSRDSSRRDEGVLPWVSMAEALGWGMTARPYPTITTGTEAGGTDPAALGGSGARRLVNNERAEGRWITGHEWSEGGPVAQPERWEARKVQGAGRIERHGERPGRSLDEPAFSIRANAGGMEPGGFRLELRPEIEAWRWKDAPATTVAGDPRITAREHHEHGEQSKTSLRLTADEAAALQSYPAGFHFAGAKGKQFLQIGNAVPPLLGRAILAEVTS